MERFLLAVSSVGAAPVRFRRSVLHGCWVGPLVLGCMALLPPDLLAEPQRRTRRVETGYATFYSRAFEGNKTASGKPFDADALVAAHRALPFGTVVRVTNLENGRRVTVRIVDRGPYGRNWREGTIIDLSLAAGRRLGMLKEGQVRARVEVIRRAPAADRPRGQL
jgi:rare lipoprotein A